MADSNSLIAALDAFADQFRAQVANAATPASEHAVHFCLALGFQAALDIAPGSIVFERPVSVGNLDLWLVPDDLVIEIKFWRPIPSGRPRPMPQHFGDLLADANRVAQIPARRRWVVLATDQSGLAYLEGHGGGLLPLGDDGPAAIGRSRVESLPATASRRAVKDGPWGPLTCSLLWRAVVEPWHLLAWDVVPRGSS